MFEHSVKTSSVTVPYLILLEEEDMEDGVEEEESCYGEEESKWILGGSHVTCQLAAAGWQHCVHLIFYF